MDLLDAELVDKLKDASGYSRLAHAGGVCEFAQRRLIFQNNAIKLRDIELISTTAGRYVEAIAISRQNGLGNRENAILDLRNDRVRGKISYLFEGVRKMEICKGARLHLRFLLRSAEGSDGSQDVGVRLQLLPEIQSSLALLLWSLTRAWRALCFVFIFLHYHSLPLLRHRPDRFCFRRETRVYGSRECRLRDKK